MLDWHYCYRMFYVAVTFKIICIDNQNKLCYLTSTQIKTFIKTKMWAWARGQAFRTSK
jgi:hypothetical protein